MKISIVDSLGQDAGYDIIPNPTTKIRPLTIVTNSCDNLGKLEDFFRFPEDAIPPEIVKNPVKAGLNKVAITATRPTITSAMLKNVMQAFRLGQVSSSIRFDKSGIEQLRFNNISSERVSPVEIAGYLRKGKLSNEELMLDLIDKKWKTFLVYDILKSDSFTFTLAKGEGSESQLILDLLMSVSTANTDIVLEQVGDRTLTCTYENPLTIGTKQFNFWTETSVLGKKVLTIGPHQQIFRTLTEESRFLSGINRQREQFGKPYAATDLNRKVRVPSFSNFSESTLQHARRDPVVIPWVPGFPGSP